MFFYTVGQVLTAFFAVVGIWWLSKTLVAIMFKEKNYIYGIEILTQRDAESAEVLIRSALCRYFVFCGGRYAVITTEELASEETMQRLIMKYGLELFIVKCDE